MCVANFDTTMLKNEASTLPCHKSEIIKTLVQVWLSAIVLGFYWTEWVTWYIIMAFVPMEINWKKIGSREIVIVKHYLAQRLAMTSKFTYTKTLII